MKYLKDNYDLVKSGEWRFHVCHNLANSDFAHLCSLTNSELSNVMLPVASSVNTEVRRFFYKDTEYYLKEYFFVSWKKHFKVLNRGRRLIRIARTMREYGFLTPDVVAIGTSGWRRRVVTAAVKDARDVWDVLFPVDNQYRGFVDDGFVYDLGRTIGRLHESGFCHGDLRWRNILTRNDAGWRFYFIDNDRTVRYRAGIPLRGRIKNLSQILFSGLLLRWPDCEWQTFQQGYFVQSTLSPFDRSKLIAKVESRAAKRFDARNALESRKEAP